MNDFVHNPAFSQLRGKLAATLGGIDSIAVGSMFSGWAVLEMVLDVLKSSWNSSTSTAPDALLEAFG